MKELIEIINELHAPKDMVNNFGKFNYRNAEGILESVKPLLHKHNCLLSCDAFPEMIGDRYYIVVSATIWNAEGKSVTAKAPAREQDSKSGMDGAQLTGACISYAKKYALCNLFNIDDSTDDPDTDGATKKQQDTNKQNTAKPATPQNPSSGATKSSAKATTPIKEENANSDKVNALKEAVGGKTLEELATELLSKTTLKEAKAFIAANGIKIQDAEWNEVRSKLNEKFQGQR